MNLDLVALPTKETIGEIYQASIHTGHPLARTWGSGSSLMIATCNQIGERERLLLQLCLVAFSLVREKNRFGAVVFTAATVNEYFETNHCNDAMREE